MASHLVVYSLFGVLSAIGTGRISALNFAAVVEFFNF